MEKTLVEQLLENPNVVLTNYDTQEEWLAARRKLVTASNVAAILGKCSFMGRLRLWYMMQGAVEDFGSHYQDERDMGHDSEAFHAALYSKLTGRLVEDPGDYCIVTNKRYPGIGCTLDRLFLDEQGMGVLEMKWVREWMRKYWEPIPEKVLYQAQTQLLVTELPRASVSAVIGGCKPVWHDIEAHKGVQAGIVRAVASWLRSLADGVPPEPTGHETDAPTLDEVFGGEDEGIIECGEDLAPQYEEWDRIAAERIAITKREDQIKAEIKAYMGPHTRAVGTNYEFNISGANRVVRRKELTT